MTMKCPFRKIKHHHYNTDGPEPRLSRIEDRFLDCLMEGCGLWVFKNKEHTVGFCSLSGLADVEYCLQRRLGLHRMGEVPKEMEGKL